MSYLFDRRNANFFIKLSNVLVLVYFYNITELRRTFFQTLLTNKDENFGIKRINFYRLDFAKILSDVLIKRSMLQWQNLFMRKTPFCMKKKGSLFHLTITSVIESRSRKRRFIIFFARNVYCFEIFLRRLYFHVTFCTIFNGNIHAALETNVAFLKKKIQWFFTYTYNNMMIYPYSRKWK